VRRHNAESISASLLLLGCGTVAFIVSRRWSLGADLPSQMAAFLGPLGLVLGLGMAIHGTAMPVSRITTLARVWGLGASAAVFLNLWLLGYFSKGGSAVRATKWLVPVALVVAWLLPARFYGDDSPPPAIPTTTSGSGSH